MILTITEKTGTCTLVQSNKTQVSDNPHRRALGGSFHALRKLALNLKTDLDDFEGVGEDLTNEQN
jgi:hypothetical protein